LLLRESACGISDTQRFDESRPILALASTSSGFDIYEVDVEGTPSIRVRLLVPKASRPF
jgi:hypothetical protein